MGRVNDFNEISKVINDVAIVNSNVQKLVKTTPKISRTVGMTKNTEVTVLSVTGAGILKSIMLSTMSSRSGKYSVIIDGVIVRASSLDLGGNATNDTEGFYTAVFDFPFQTSLVVKFNPVYDSEGIEIAYAI